jgi:hypothetical protein
MSEIRKYLDDQKQANWAKVIANESHLLPFITVQQRTMRAAKLIPTFELYSQTEVFWRMRKAGVDGALLRKFRAWWELLFEVQRYPDDEATIKLALAYVVQEHLQQGYGKNMPVDPAQFGIVGLDHVAKVQIAVKSRIKDLCPREVAAGASAESLLRLKLEKQPKG